MENFDDSQDLNILLVDDNHDLVTTTAILLKLHGFKVVMCSDGKECIEAAQELKPDVIITDIEMPVMDGVTACNFIRQQSWGKQIPIIALSGNVEILSDDPPGKSCFDALLRKPAQFEDLIRTIWKTVKAKR
jgi:CheY-like chemotaxis protein